MNALLMVLSLLMVQDQQQEELRVAFLGLEINQILYQDVQVYLGENEIWMQVESLQIANISGFEGRRQFIGGDEYVELGSLAPGFRAQIDMGTVTLLLAVDPRYLPETTLDLVNPRPADLQYVRNTSAYFNYSARYDTGSGTSFFGEGNFSAGGHSALVTFNVDTEGKFKRSTTSLTFDQPDSLRRSVLGDVQGRGLLLGSAAFVGGASIRREFSLDPYYFTYATPTFAGSVTSPSTVDVIVNGQPGQRFDLPPGNFQLSRLPTFAGLGDVQVIVRDVFGREQSFDARYYLSTRVLRKGLRDYEYVGGWQRTDTGEKVEYDTPTAYARDRYGITDNFTLGYRAEGTADIFNAGPVINVKMFRLGELELLGAASSDGDTTGYAAAGNYFFNSRTFSLSGFFRWQGDGYGDVFLSPTDPREDLAANMIATFPVFSRGSFSLGYQRNQTVRIVNSDGSISYVPVSRSTDPDAPRFVRRRALARVTSNLFRRLQLNISATFNVAGEDRFWDAFAGITMAVGGRTSASASWERRDRKERLRADINRSLPLGPGYGYRVEANNDGDGTVHANLQAQARFMRLDARYDVAAEPAPELFIDQVDTPSTTSTSFRQSGSLTLSGSMVAMGGRMSFSRPVTGSSFALIRLPEAPGVEVFSNQQNMGRTGGSGAVFVPDLLAYYGNRLSFNDQQVPLDVIIEETSRYVAPPFRGGAVVEFPLRRLRAIRGTVVLERDGEVIVPEYGDFVVETAEGPRRSPLTRVGRFYIEDVTPDTYAARVMFAGETCSFDIQVPLLLQPVTDVGELRCVLR